MQARKQFREHVLVDVHAPLARNQLKLSWRRSSLQSALAGGILSRKTQNANTRASTVVGGDGGGGGVTGE